MAAMVLVLQIMMVTQRGLITNIRAFALAVVPAGLHRQHHRVLQQRPTYLRRGGVHAGGQGDSAAGHLRAPGFKIEIRQEIEPLVNAPISVIITGLLTLLAYVVAESFHRPDEPMGPASLGHNTLAVAIALFLIGFFMMVNRRKALTQVLALLSLENGILLAAISLTYGMPHDCGDGNLLRCPGRGHGACHPHLPHSRDFRLHGRQPAEPLERLKP